MNAWVSTWWWAIALFVFFLIVLIVAIAFGRTRHVDDERHGSGNNNEECRRGETGKQGKPGQTGARGFTGPPGAGASQILYSSGAFTFVNAVFVTNLLSSPSEWLIGQNRIVVTV